MKQVIVIFCLIISLFACNNFSVEGELKEKSQKQELTIEGESLSDSMAQIIIQEHLPFELDSAKIWDDIHFVEIPDWKNYKMDFDTVMKYTEQLPSPNPHFQDYFAVSYSFAQLHETSHYQSYIFINEIDESHYSESALLVTVDNDWEIIDELELAIQYGNEMQEMYRSSVFKNANQLERTTETVFHYLHDVGKVDSTTVETQHFHVDTRGNIVLEKD